MDASIWVAIVSGVSGVVVALLRQDDLARASAQQDLLSRLNPESKEAERMRAALAETVRRHHDRATNRTEI